MEIMFYFNKKKEGIIVMEGYRNMKRLFIVFSAVTMVMLLFYLQINIFKTSKIMDRGILTDINRNIVRKYGLTDYITKAESTNFYPCADIIMPKLIKRASKWHKWQPVHDDLTAFVFSAYFVHEKKTIVVISIRKQDEAKIYFCQYWYKRGNQFALSFQNHAKIVALPSTHGLAYAAELFECRIHGYGPSPSYVSIVDINCTSPKNILFVHHVIKPLRIKRNFTLCLSPIFGNPNIYRFVEWIELNNMLGADKFFIYNYTSEVKISKLLEFYSNSGTVNIIQWSIPEIYTEANVTALVSIHYHGQIAALNDCLYRNKYESEYIVNIDMDEFIIPHMDNVTTWHQMLTHLDLNKTVYIVRNVFFSDKWNKTNIEISNKTLVEKYDLITLNKMEHDIEIFRPGKRSKYFARTSSVSSVKIHTVNLTGHTFSVPVNISYLHHYRDFRFKNNLERKKVIDQTVPKKYGKALIKKIETVWSELNRYFSN